MSTLPDLTYLQRQLARLLQNTKLNGPTTKTLNAIGACTAFYYGYTLVNSLTIWFTPFKSTFRAYRQSNSKKKSYVLITGSSAGIGLELARDFAKRDFGVVLLAHVQSELDQAKHSIQGSVPTASIKTVCINCRQFTNDQLRNELEKLQDLDLRVLVNNVASLPQTTPYYNAYPDHSNQSIDDQINCNARFMAQISNMLLPILRDNAEKDHGRSLLLNVSSPAKSGMIYLATYSGTKGFNASLSNAIHQEAIAQEWPIDVLCILPGEVRSSGHQTAVSPYAQPTEEFARQTLDIVEPALRHGRQDIMPYWRAALQFYIFDYVVPSSVQKKLTRDMLQWKYNEERK